MLDQYLEMPDDPRIVHTECLNCLSDVEYFYYQLEFSCTECNECFNVPEPDVDEPWEIAYDF